MPILKRITTHGWAFLFATAIVFGAAGVSHAVTYDLVTGTVPVTMPDGRTVTMWGFGLSGGPITVPGPTLDVPNGQNLTINLTNNLPVPVSIVVPGLGLGASPTPVMDLNNRVQSFTAEAAANGGQASYTFTARPGTYLYESGSDPALEIPMGLYGGIRAASGTAGWAYNSPVSAFANEAMLLFSEVDYTLNDAVAAGTFGTPAYPSTANFKPQYFLINGKAYFQDLHVPVYVGPTGSNVLLRLLNAGSSTRMPMVQGVRMKCIAEDGYLCAYPHENFSAVLPPGKTKDAIVVLPANGNYPLYDRRQYMTNAGSFPGGALTFLNVAAQSTPFNLSVSAASGLTGVAQQVVANWGSSNGAADLKNVQLQVGTVATGGIVRLRYITATNLLYMLNDAGTAWLGGFAPGSANTISNSRCTLDCAATTVTASGNNLTVSFNLTPLAGYTGNKNLLMNAINNANVSTGFQLKGAWTVLAVPNVAPVNVSVSAAAGTAGVAQQVGAVWSDANGATDLKNVQLKVGTGATGGTIVVRYVRATNLLYMMNDTGTAWLGGFAPGSANTISNSRGSLNCALTTVTPAGNDLSASFNLTPAATYSGNKALFQYAIDNQSATAAWALMGFWNIAP